MQDWVNKVKTQKNFIISNENSVNGYKSFLTFWMKIPKQKKSQLMQVLKSNLIIGELECKKSPTGVNN